MIWRHELKYMVDESACRHLYYALAPILRRDRHENGESADSMGGYRIRSLYFDDLEKRGIFEKLAGTDPRHKYRIRIYNNEDNVIRLEKKIKSGQLTQKHSCVISKILVDALLGGDVEPLYAALCQNNESGNLDLLGQFYAEWRTRYLRPSLLVDYWRTPLVWPDGNVRITFDRYLSTGRYRQDLWDNDASLQAVLPPGTVIMEVKYDHFLPSFINDLLNLQGVMSLSLSKYLQCAASCRTHSWEDQG